MKIVKDEDFRHINSELSWSLACYKTILESLEEIVDDFENGFIDGELCISKMKNLVDYGKKQNDLAKIKDEIFERGILNRGLCF